MKKVVSTSKAPAAIGPYSQGIQAGNMYFFSGALGLDPETGNFVSETDVTAQTEKVFENIKALLEEAGCGFEDVVKTTVFLADMAYFADMNAVYGKYFKEPYPARSAVAVKTLPKNALVEVEVIVVK